MKLGPTTSFAALTLAFALFGTLCITSVAAQSSAPCKSEDPNNIDAELADCVGATPFIPDWQHDMEKPVDPTAAEQGDDEMNNALNEPSAPGPTSLVKWYGALDQEDQLRVRDYAFREGMKNDDGTQFSKEDFEAYLPAISLQLTKGLNSDNERAKVIHQIALESGVMPDFNESDLPPDFGVTGSTGPRSDIDTSH